MTSRERVCAAIRCQDVDRVPWVPFVGCHAGALLGAPASEYLQSTDLIVRGMGEAVARYQPDGIPVCFDLQIEAETLGCGLQWAPENPPAVATHPLEGGRSAEGLRIPGCGDGRVGMAIEAARRLRAAHPDLALYGLVTGPLTLALHLRGTEIFMQIFDDPASLADLMGFCQRVGEAMATYYIEAGCDAVAVVDPMTSQIGPEHFEQIVAPFAKPLFAHIRAQGALSSFFVCGHAQQNIQAMCACGPDNVSVDENIPLDYVRDICLARGVSFGGNMQLTTVLLLGGPDDARRNALACMDIGGARGYLLAPGCDLAYATPPENLAAVGALVRDPYAQEVTRTLARECACGGASLDMSAYGTGDKVVVDVITLDSEACAPCQYMVEAVKAVAPQFEQLVEWREHKIKYRESLVFMTSLMVRNVPTICIDGQITFVSRIPPRDELIAAIQKRIFEKLRVRIQRRRATLCVLGAATEATAEAERRCRQAVMELGADVDVQRVEDEAVWREYGIVPGQTPGILLTRHQIKAVKTIPEVGIIKEWVKELD